MKFQIPDSVAAYDPQSAERIDDLRHRVDRLRAVAYSDAEYRELERRVCDLPWGAEYKLELLDGDEAATVALEKKYESAFEQRAQRNRAERLQSLNLPITTSDAEALSSGQFEKTRAIKTVSAWATGNKPLLVLSGTPGRGKTFAASNVLARWRGGVRYTRAIDVARLFLAQFGEEVEQREDLVREPSLLVVDDIGTERNADAMCTALVEILDARRRGQRTIWITNLDRPSFELRYPDMRLHSRIAQSGLWIADTGTDLRRSDS